MTEKTTFQSDNAFSNDFGVFVYEQTITKSSGSLVEIFQNHGLITQLQDRLGYQFNQINYLINALTHRSFVHEYTHEARTSYERLEFLGDSVLGSYVSYALFEKYSDCSEGKLSKLRSALVNEHSLAKLGRFLGADKCLLLGRGELQSELNDSLICDVVEAILGAITLDDSINRAFEALANIISQYELEMKEDFFSEKKLYLFDPKTTLQELTMKEYKSLPVYESHNVEGGFRVELFVNDEKVEEVTCHSKKIAMKELALKYLNKITK
ncbi:MAG: ribonuclease III [Bacteriovorax sp. MedPE-SWde]|nr:MAG: ribonuclease III [Bacteriovorax sp. MedPE-SWde]